MTFQNCTLNFFYLLFPLAGQKPPLTSENKTYGLHPFFKKFADEPKSQIAEPKVSVSDRVATAEAKVLGFVAEKSMTFSDVPDIIALSKSLAKDKAALDQLKMDRTTASYKMIHGLGKTFEDELVSELRETLFSLNMDECTSQTNIKVVTVLVSYYSLKNQKVMVKHLSSFSIEKCDSETLYNELVKMFDEMNLPWENLISILMDSCNVMRGSKSGLETRIRKNKAPHLLDIDGDTCHHAHNACKRFCEHFEKYIELLLTNLHNDFKWSADKKVALELICKALGIKYTVPANYAPHRWLSVYDISVDTERMLDAYIVFYSAFLTKNDKEIYEEVVSEIYKRHGVDKSTITAMNKVLAKMGKKKMTPDGQARTKRIVSKLFHTLSKTKVQLHIYTSVLPLLKKYTMLFQMNKTMIHLLNDKQIELVSGFLTLFIKPEVIANAKNIQNVQLDECNHLPTKNIFLVNYINANMKGENAKTMIDTLKGAYVACSTYLLSKMPINNKLLKSISALDPRCQGHSITLKYLLQLPSLVTNVIEKEESVKYDLEVRKYVSSTNPNPVNYNDDIVEWWNKIDKGEYPCLTRMAFGLLSCFHGPEVESSFSLMQQVMNKRTGSLHVESLSAIQTVKYKFKSHNKSALQYFSRDLHDPVDPQLCQNMRTAYKRYQEQKGVVKENEEEKLRDLGITKKPTVSISSKTKAKLQSYARAQSNIQSHQDNQKKAASSSSTQAVKQKNPSTKIQNHQDNQKKSASSSSTQAVKRKNPSTKIQNHQDNQKKSASSSSTQAVKRKNPSTTPKPKHHKRTL